MRLARLVRAKGESRFTRHLRAELAAVADPRRAVGMQAYMKSTMPYYGVTSPQVDALCKKVFAENPFPSYEEWQAAILELWRGARYLEGRYVASTLVSLKRRLTFSRP